ncbi:MAG: exodeoxyribonuclease VII large subunit, partial [Candidatus Omnitrophota bacterium]|nr:exodeoxyribonuclease VII large subunit [Candidatus Omnitrophota bacterium]
EKRVLSVSELTRLIRAALEDNFYEIWVEGELSNFKKHTSGHMYFSLKDETAVLNCVLFRSANKGIKFKIENGMRVICFGRVSVYDKRGQYQLYVDKLEPKGIGALQMAFEQLKNKLQKEGIFDESRKKPIPYLPGRIGIVTSPTGAAIRDILNVVKRRFQNAEVILSPVRVQGENAETEIAQAIEDFNVFNGKMPEGRKVDVLVVGRGGGSIEDLWSFNEEIVARAIFKSGIPVISAVGHEIDWTIADFAADKRAPTPSAAAELVIPEKEDLLARLEGLTDCLDNAVIDKITFLKDELKALSESYILKQPINIIEQYQQRVDDLTHNINLKTSHVLDIKKAAFDAAYGKLDMLSPFKVLSRGYSITTRLESGRVLKDAAALKKGSRVSTRLAKGVFISEVVERTDDGRKTKDENRPSS